MRKKSHFAPPEVAFSSAYRPGFSTYPEGRTFKEVYAALAEHGSPGWISAEGTNVSPTSMPGEPTMETYLGRMFNHGGVMMNVFSWGIGGEAHAQQLLPPGHGKPRMPGGLCKIPARRSARGIRPPRAFPGRVSGPRCTGFKPSFQAGYKRSGQQTQAMPLINKVKALIKDKEMAGSRQGGR